MTSNVTNPIDTVAAHVLATQYEDLPEATVERVKTFLLDTIGVAMAGTSGAGIEELIQVADSWGAGSEASVWFSGETLPAQSAALVNAYQIHCMEFDCVHEGAVLHPMATIMGALMAWIEREKSRGNVISGKALITALALGVDVSTMLGVVTESPLEFFRPATAGGFGAATAIAKLAGFDELTLKNALGAQYSQTSGTLQAHVEGSPMLGMQVGFNSRAAIVACDLAQAGFRGPHDILTGQYGYFRLFENNSYQLEPFLERLGKQWQIDELSHKPFPSGRLTHGSVHALMQLQKQHSFNAQDIDTIVCTVPPLVNRLVGRPLIDNMEPNYAKLCLRFVVGVYLKHNWVDIPHFLGDALTDTEVLETARKVDVIQDANPDLNALNPQHIVVTLNSGDQLDITLDSVYGDPQTPLSAEENVEKFTRCCSRSKLPLAEAQQQHIIEFCRSLEQQEDVASLITAMNLQH